MMKRLFSAAFLGIVMLSLAGTLLASPLDWFDRETSDHHENENQRDVQLMNVTKVSLGQAVTGAEQQTAEKAVGADLVQDKKSGTIYYSVETLGAKTSHIVDIDALTGKVVKVKDDTRQDDHENGEEDH